MNVKVLRNDIIDGLQKSSSIIPSKTGAAFLRTLWLEAKSGNLRIFSTDSSLEFTGEYDAKIDEEGLVGVQGKNFHELIRKLPQGEITMYLDTSTSNLIITQGTKKYKLPTSDKSWFQNFSKFPETGISVWSGDFLQELIDRVLFCISDEDTMQAMACMYFKPESLESKVEVCGLNGHQFALTAFLNDDIHEMLPGEGILIQKKYVAELKKWLTADEIELAINQKRLFFRSSDKSEVFSLPLSYYQYPDYSSFVNKLSNNDVSVLKVNRDDLLESLSRISIFNTDTNRCAYFKFETSNELSIISQGQEAGEANEILNVEFYGELKQIAFPTKDIIDILNHFNSQDIKFMLTGSEGPCGITGTDDPEYVVIIMPMKIIEETYYNEEFVS